MRLFMHTYIVGFICMCVCMSLLTVARTLCKLIARDSCNKNTCIEPSTQAHIHVFVCMYHESSLASCLEQQCCSFCVWVAKTAVNLWIVTT